MTAKRSITVKGLYPNGDKMSKSFTDTNPLAKTDKVAAFGQAVAGLVNGTYSVSQSTISRELFTQSGAEGDTFPVYGALIAVSGAPATPAIAAIIPPVDSDTNAIQIPTSLLTAETVEIEGTTYTSRLTLYFVQVDQDASLISLSDAANHIIYWPTGPLIVGSVTYAEGASGPVYHENSFKEFQYATGGSGYAYGQEIILRYTEDDTPPINATEIEYELAAQRDFGYQGGNFFFKVDDE